MNRKPAIIAYDISSNKQRRKVARVLTQWRLDGQYSVVECYLSTQEAEELLLQLTEYIDETTDSIVLAWVHDMPKLKTLGSGKRSFQQLGVLRVH